MIHYSPLEQFEILPIFKIPFIFTNSTLFLVIGLIFVTLYFFVKNKFIPTRFQQIFEIMFNTTTELTYGNIGKDGKHFIPLMFVVFFLYYYVI
jgi:F0F1-type ATP synthase membrane subunit a